MTASDLPVRAENNAGSTETRSEPCRRQTGANACVPGRTYPFTETGLSLPLDGPDIKSPNAPERPCAQTNLQLALITIVVHSVRMAEVTLCWR
jgi:hypothetical protein